MKRGGGASFPCRHTPCRQLLCFRCRGDLDLTSNDLLLDILYLLDDLLTYQRLIDSDDRHALLEAIVDLLVVELAVYRLGNGIVSGIAVVQKAGADDVLGSQGGLIHIHADGIEALVLSSLEHAEACLAGRR